MFVLAWIRRLYKVLSADASPSAIAFAAAFGLAAGFVPCSSGYTQLLVLLVVVFRVQISTEFFRWLTSFWLTKALRFAFIGPKT